MINKLTAFAVGLALPIAGYIVTASTVIQYQQEPAVPVTEEPAIPTASEIPIEEPEPIKELPEGVICLDDCPLIEVAVRDHFADVGIMVEIARCESGFRQFDKEGKPLKNPGSTATGVFQLMASYHREPASNLGMDIDTVEGNLGYAMVMYEQSGTVPWNESRPCWQKHYAYSK
ncbi:hypothetical protein KA005_64180 [bacterium]|nr:hypothetical protein [bacterium]